MYIGADEKAHSGLLASVVGGQLWDRLGPSATFWYGGAFGLLGILALGLLVSNRRHG